MWGWSCCFAPLHWHRQTPTLGIRLPGILWVLWGFCCSCHPLQLYCFLYSFPVVHCPQDFAWILISFRLPCCSTRFQPAKVSTPRPSWLTPALAAVKPLSCGVWSCTGTANLHHAFTPSLSPLSPGRIQELMYSLSSLCPHCQPWGKLSSTRPYTSQQPLSAQARRASGNELPPRCLARRRQPSPMVPGPCCVPEPGPSESVASRWALQLHLPLPPAPRTPLSAVLAAAPVTCPFCAARRLLQRLCL